MSSSVYFLLGLFFLFIQSHPFLPFGTNGLRPDLVMLLVTYAATKLEIPLFRGALVAWLLGYFFAVFSGSPPGLYSCILLLIFLFVRLLRSFFVLQQVHVLLLLATGCCLLEGVMLFMAFWIFYDRSGIFRSFSFMFIGQVVFTIALAPVIIVLLQKFDAFCVKNKKLPVSNTYVSPFNMKGLP